ncbi:MAG: protoporphyrinogen oxidase [Chloroflexota bacterium]|nr:protoporphyrinogen oxidase [Chloroflexota bacterium]
MRRRIAIVGAGISGLACAIRLHAIDPELEIVVYERDRRVGGKILTERTGGFTIEAGPDAFLASKRGGLSFSRLLGLEDRLISPIPENRRSYVLNRGKLVPLPQGLSGLVPTELKPMLQSRILSPAGKLRMAMDLAIRPRTAIGDESLASFIRRRMGTEMYERMIEPLLSGIYAGDGERLSLAATFPQLRASELTHGGVIKGALAQKQERSSRTAAQTPRTGFLSFEGGMSELVDRALEVVTRNGGRVLYGAGCERVQCGMAGPGYRLTIAQPGGEVVESFDGVVLAVPAWAAAPLLTDVAPDAGVELERIEHVSNALIVIAFPESQLSRPLNGYGYIVPRAERRDVMAMTWISSKWDGRAPQGQVLLRAFVGRAGQGAALEGDDESLVQLTLKELKDVLGFDVVPSMTRVYRWDRGMPQYNMGHIDRVDRIDAEMARLPGIELAGNYLRGVGIPDCVVSGETAAANLVADLQEQARRTSTTSPSMAN